MEEPSIHALEYMSHLHAGIKHAAQQMAEEYNQQFLRRMVPTAVRVKEAGFNFDERVEAAKEWIKKQPWHIPAGVALGATSGSIFSAARDSKVPAINPNEMGKMTKKQRAVAEFHYDKQRRKEMIRRAISGGIMGGLSGGLGASPGGRELIGGVSDVFLGELRQLFGAPPKTSP